MNGSADEADVLRFLNCGSGADDDDCVFGAGYCAGYGFSDGSGDGSGNGSGACSASGESDGSGYSCGDGGNWEEDDGWGSGYSYGSGSGYGAGYGNGGGSGIKTFNGQKVFCVDDVATIISSVHGGYARGYILLTGLTLKPTYIAKVDGFFAHGDTLRAAREDAVAKYVEHRPVE